MANVIGLTIAVEPKKVEVAPKEATPIEKVPASKGKKKN